MVGFVKGFVDLFSQFPGVNIGHFDPLIVT
jgi:hypothetical protein